MWTQEIKLTANRRESALRANIIGFAYPHLNSAGLVARQSLAPLRPPLWGSPPQLRPAAFSVQPARPAGSSLIGNVRANPVAAPAAPIVGLSLDLMS